MIALRGKLLLVILIFAGQQVCLAQAERGGVVTNGSPKPTPSPSHVPTGSGKTSSGGGKSRSVPCSSASLSVSCGMPGCEISIDGGSPTVIDETGRFPLSPEKHEIKIQKAGYAPQLVTREISCQSQNHVSVSLVKLQPNIRIRTQPAEAEVLINGKTAGKSDASGVLAYIATSPRLLIEAHKSGHLPANATVSVDFAEPNPEVLLVLKPLPARIDFNVDVPEAKVLIDDQNYQPITGPLEIPPGKHRITIEALGYSPVTFAIDLAPDSVEKRNVSLKRLSAAELRELAERRYRERAYQEVLRLTQFALEVDPHEPTANRLAGLAFLALRNYQQAEIYLAKGLAGQEIIELPVRRHARESFDSRKPHDSCEASLRFSKNEIEFRGKQYTLDNFKVSYSQVRVLGLLLKNNSAVYLATKVTDASGKTREFNFYSNENELSQAGRPYLEMLQRLMHSH